MSPRSEKFPENESKMGTEVLVLGSGEGVKLVNGGDIWGGLRVEREMRGGESSANLRDGEGIGVRNIGEVC